MKCVLILILILAVAPTWAQIETERAVIETINVQKPEQAKPFLLHKAVLDAISQYSTELGFDANVFKGKLEEKFQNYFEGYKNRKLAEKFGKNYTLELTDDQKKAFIEGLETGKTQEFIKFSRLDQLLDSYAFKSISNDPDAPENWKAEIVLNLNRQKLQKMNSRLMSTETKTYSKLQILAEVNLLGLSWPDIGLDKETSFTDPILDSWQKWFSTNLPSNVEEVSICTGACMGEFSDWQQLSQEEGMQVPENILNSLWLKVSYNLRKVRFVPDINEWQFEWDGSVVLLDANTKKIISSYTLLPETKTWRGLDQKSMNSALASAMYKSPIDSFLKVSKKTQDTPRLNRLSRLVIQGHKHLGDVLILMDMLRKEGAAHSFEVQIDLFTQKEVELLCFYQGEEKSFTDLLSRLKELKSSHSYSLVNEFTGVHHVLKFVAE